jgi:hypothetical protein
VTVIAVDPYGNTDMNYTGTIHFTTSDMDPGVVLPPDYTFQASDAGMATFPGGVTLITPGVQTLTATDTVSGITGSATVTLTAGPDIGRGTFPGAISAAVAPAEDPRVAPAATEPALDAVLAAMTAPDNGTTANGSLTAWSLAPVWRHHPVGDFALDSLALEEWTIT